jgi:hypothetical protein
VGAELRTDVAQMPSFDRPELAQALDSVVGGAESVASDAAGLSSPSPEGEAAQNFVRAMTDRALGVSRLRSTLDGLLAITPNAPLGSSASSSPFPPRSMTVAQAVASVANVGRLLVQADRSYTLARREFRAVPGGSTLPKSVWVTDPLVWDAGAVETTVNQLSSSPTLAPLVDVRLVAIELTPPVLPPAPAVPGQQAAPALAAGVSQIPPSCTVAVTAVVKNEGSVVAAKVPVLANLQPVAGGAPFVVQKTTTLAPGASVALELQEIPVQPGATYDLSVTITPPTGQTSSPGPEGSRIEVASFGSSKGNGRCARTPAAAP